MKLIYHQGANFGDAVNPIIFKHFAEDLLMQTDEFDLLGIGSILGLKRLRPNSKKAIVFSSGFAAGNASTYGNLPTHSELAKYDFRCVRGPLTCKELNLPKHKGIADGAILLPEVLPLKSQKEHQFAYMPHVGSLNFYRNWKDLIESIGIKFIDPSESVHQVLDELGKTEVLLCEAMHGAIIADTYRIPWIPLKTNSLINDFKWNDYCMSMELDYRPHHVNTLYDKTSLTTILGDKLAKIKMKNSFTAELGSFAYAQYQSLHTENLVKKQFKNLKLAQVTISKSSILNQKKEQLQEEFRLLKKDYLQS